MPGTLFQSLDPESQLTILDATKRGVLRFIAEEDVDFADAWTQAQQRVLNKVANSPEDIRNLGGLSFRAGKWAALDVIRARTRRRKIIVEESGEHDPSVSNSSVNHPLDNDFHHDPWGSLSGNILREAEQSALAECMESLPGLVREVVKLKYLHEESVSSIAHKTGKTVHSIYKALERARESLHDCIKRKLTIWAES